MKKLICLLTVLVLLCAMLPAAYAVEHSGSCGAKVNWKLNTENGELTLSGSGDMKNYAKEEDVPWYEYRDSILTVDVGSNITSIGNYAFCHCENMTSADLPSSLKVIGYQSFEFCYSLETIKIGKNVNDIDYLAFESCYSLDGIWVDSGNSKYSSDSDGVLFSKNKGTLIAAPGSLSGDYELPSGVANIEDWAFSCCKNLKSITINKNMTALGIYVFNHCSGLEAIHVESGNSKYSSDSVGILFNADKTKLLRAPAALSGAYEIPDSVTAIDDYGFYECDQVTNITIPDSVKTIGENCFFNCKSLVEIYVPDSVTSVGKNAFYLCDQLIFAQLGEGVESIGENCFYACSALTIVSVLNEECKIADTEYTLGDSSFTTVCGKKDSTAQEYAEKYNYKYLASDGGGNFFSGSCGSGVTWTLNNDTGEMTVSGAGTMDSYDSAEDTPWYESREKIETVVMDAGVRNIGDRAFADCTALTSVSCGQDVAAVGVESFAGCTALTGITFSGAPETFSNGCFAGCTALEQFELPDSVSELGAGAFRGCDALTKIILNEKISDLRESAFEGCTALEVIVLPNTLRTLGDRCFAGCTALNTVTLSNALRTLGKECFSGCTALTELELPESVMLVYENAMSGCTALKRVTVYNPGCTVQPGDETMGNIDTVIISAEFDSDVEKYAMKYNYKFEGLYAPAEVETEPVETEPVPEETHAEVPAEIESAPATEAPEPETETEEPETDAPAQPAPGEEEEEDIDWLPIILVGGAVFLLVIALIIIIVLISGKKKGKYGR